MRNIRLLIFFLPLLMVACDNNLSNKTEVSFQIESVYSRYQKVDYATHDTTYHNTVYQMTAFYPAQTLPNEPLPLVVLLDGFWYYDWVSQMITQLSEQGHIPPCLLVSVDYKDLDGAAARSGDYIYTYPDKNSDYYEPYTHGADFYSFLQQELLPYVQENYAIDKNNVVLMGHSLGGLFTLYSMLDNPEDYIFTKAIAASCSVGQYNNYLFDKEEEVNQAVKAGIFSQPFHNIRLFMGCGMLVGNAPATHQAFFDQLSGRGYDTTIDYKEYKATHATDPYYIFRDGLIFVFSDYE